MIQVCPEGKGRGTSARVWREKGEDEGEMNESEVEKDEERKRE